MGPSSTIASLLIKLGLDPSGIEAGVNQAQGSLGKLTSKANMATSMAGAAVGNFAVGSMQAFMGFDDRMNEIFSIMPGITQAAMAKMESDVRSTAVRMGLDAQEVASGVYDAISSGIDPSQVTGFIETASKAAVAGVSDAKSAAAVLASTLNAYSMDASHAGEVADILFQTVNKGVTTFPELAAQMATISPVASVMGVDLTQTTAALAAMTLQGHNTAAAATDIAAVFTLLQKGTPDLTKVLDAAGYASGQAALDALGFQGTLEMLRDTADSLGIAIPSMTGRVQAANAIFALTGDKAGAALEVLESYEGATGSVDRAFEVMQSGIGGTVRRLQATLQDLSITVGGALEPIAPLFLAFGPQMGRLLGSGIGAGLGLGLKGLGSIVRKALPGLASTLTEIGAEAGGGMGKGIVTSVVGYMKGAGAKKLLAGAGLMVGGQLLSGATEGMGGGVAEIGAIAGAAMTIGGAFAIGGPVLAGIAAITLAVKELLAFMDKVGSEQAKLDAQVAAISEQTAKQAIDNLQNMTNAMAETQGIARMFADTWAGAQQMDSLTAFTDRIVNLAEGESLAYMDLVKAVQVGERAVVEARARGNEEVAKQLEANVQMMVAMRDEAGRATDGMYHGMAADAKQGLGVVAAAIGAGGNKVENAVTEFTGDFRAKVAEGASVISSAWDTLTGALSEGPKIMSMEKRMQTARKAITENVRKLRQAIKVGDTVAASAYAGRVVDARAAVRALRGSEGEKALKHANTVLANSRRIAARHHKGMAADAKRESAKGARSVERNAEKAGKAMPDELRDAKPSAVAAAVGIATGVRTPMEGAATSATTWGAHLGQNYAAGIMSQVGAVAASSAALAAAASGNIKMSAPPRKGPLSTIRTWGPHLIENWIGPMRSHLRRVEGMGDALGRAITPRPGQVAFAAGVDSMRAVGPRGGHLSRSEGSGGGDVHIHIGTLIADDRGLDELERRMARRKGMRSRGPMRYQQ